ncbi:class II fructose-bisphosphate aldolase [Amphibacillus sp. Q70]|uniref:class II fructose-bisphosphate aldolase n=1 Tax=Amphibacillus sp. Q70 TaxID=3453416 RepID=UPI003F8451B9
MLVSTQQMLKKARKEKYAVLAINTQGGHYDIIRAVVKAAEAKNAPIILAHYVSTGAYSGHKWFVKNAKYLAEQVSVPVAIHLDHGENFEICMEALKLGFTSLMYDASMKTIEKNINETNEIIKVAHAFDVPVEAEIGALQRIGEESSKTEEGNIVSAETVLGFLEKCQPDSLAIGIGNAHGYYEQAPNLRLDLLDEISEYTDIPLVLHGCTGMSDQQIKEAISKGMAKINFGTMIRTKFVEYLKEAVLETNHQNHAWKISQYASDRLQEDIEKLIELSGSTNKS